MTKKVPFSKIRNSKYFRFDNMLWQKIGTEAAQVVRGIKVGKCKEFVRCTLVTPVNARLVVEKQ
jgi:hypothetical protein